jgi:hypothetical protein
MSTSTSKIKDILHYSLFVAAILLFVGEIILLLLKTDFWASMIGTMLMGWGASALAFYLIRDVSKRFDSFIRLVVKAVAVIGGYAFTLGLMMLFTFGVFEFQANFGGSAYNLIVAIMQIIGLLPIVGFIVLTEQEKTAAEPTKTLKKSNAP